MRGAWLAAVLVGCYQPKPLGGAPCTTSSECPSTQLCEHGVCGGPPIDAPGGADAVGDAAPDGQPPIDAPPGCAPPVTGTFAAPTLNTQLSSPSGDGTPTVSSDLLEIYFKSGRPGGAGNQDLWRATRTSATAPWSAPVVVTELNSPDSDVSPELSSDGLTLWFSSRRTGSQEYDIWMSTRATPGAPWTTPVHVPELSSPEIDEGMFVLPSGLIAYLHSDRGRPSGSMALLRTTRASLTSPWQMPVAVPGIDPTPASENPWVTPDDCTMYFHTGPANSGESELVVARRATPTSPFGAPTPLTTLNEAAAYDADPWLSPDQRTILFVSDRLGASGEGYDLFDSAR